MRMGSYLLGLAAAVSGASAAMKSAAQHFADFAHVFGNPRRALSPIRSRDARSSSPLMRRGRSMTAAQQKRCALKRRNRLRHKARIQRKRA